MYYFSKNIPDKHFCCVINHLTFQKYLFDFILSFELQTHKYLREKKRKEKKKKRNPTNQPYLFQTLEYNHFFF